MTRTVTALFEDPSKAERARERLAELGVPRGSVAIHAAGAKDEPAATPDAPGAEPWLPGLLDALFLPTEEVAAHREALNRGMVLLTAGVPEELADRAGAALDEAGAEDFDAHEAKWREAGWSPAAMAGAVREDGDASSMPMMSGTGGMDAEAARMAMNGTMGINTMGAAAPDPAGSGQMRDPRKLARREPRIGRARSYVIEAPLAEERDAANDALPGATGVA
jgi:hypothetical protein